MSGNVRKLLLLIFFSFFFLNFFFSIPVNDVGMQTRQTVRLVCKWQRILWKYGTCWYFTYSPMLMWVGMYVYRYLRWYYFHHHHQQQPQRSNDYLALFLRTKNIYICITWVHESVQKIKKRTLVNICIYVSCIANVMPMNSICIFTLFAYAFMIFICAHSLTSTYVYECTLQYLICISGKKCISVYTKLLI